MKLKRTLNALYLFNVYEWTVIYTKTSYIETLNDLNRENAVREGGFEGLCVAVWENIRVSCNISLRTLRNDSNECYAVSLQYLRIETVKRLAIKKVLRLVLFEIDIWMCL